MMSGKDGYDGCYLAWFRRNMVGTWRRALHRTCPPCLPRPLAAPERTGRFRLASVYSKLSRSPVSGPFESPMRADCVEKVGSSRISGLRITRRRRFCFRPTIGLVLFPGPFSRLRIVVQFGRLPGRHVRLPGRAQRVEPRGGRRDRFRRGARAFDGAPFGAGRDELLLPSAAKITHGARFERLPKKPNARRD